MFKDLNYWKSKIDEALENRAELNEIDLRKVSLRTPTGSRSILMLLATTLVAGRSFSELPKMT